MCIRIPDPFLPCVPFRAVVAAAREGAAQPGDLVSMSYLGRYSISALEILNDESCRSGALGYLIQDEPDAGVQYAVDVYRVESSPPTSMTLSSSGRVFTRILLRVDLSTLSFTPMELR